MRFPSLTLTSLAILWRCSDASSESKTEVTSSSSFSVAHDTSPPLLDFAGAVVHPENQISNSNVVSTLRRKRTVIGDTAENIEKTKSDEALDDGTIASNNRGSVLEDPKLTFDGIGQVESAELNGARYPFPDPVGDVGRDDEDGQGYYVQAINEAFAIYSKTDGYLVAGPFALSSLWEGFRVNDCASFSIGRPIVLYDQLEDRWLLSRQTLGCFFGGVCYSCVAISTTSDPTGSYNRYAFAAQQDPDGFIGETVQLSDPKYGVWSDSYILTTRDFSLGGNFSVSVYAIEKAPMILGNANTRVQQFILKPGINEVLDRQINNGLLPPDIDGSNLPPPGAPAPIIGTVDNDLVYGFPWTEVDGINIWNLSVNWRYNTGTLTYTPFLEVDEFSSVFPCGFFCSAIPQPGGFSFLDPVSDLMMHRLSYRNFGTYESLLTVQTVDAAEGKAGLRWFEIRRANTEYSVYQQSTYSPRDNISRWVGSIAQDKHGNIALGYSVSNSFDVHPGLRITGRRKDDPLGFMTLGEATVVNGSGSKNAPFDWGRYYSTNIDPDDDETFWFTGQYYTLGGEVICDDCWKTRVAAFNLVRNDFDTEQCEDVKKFKIKMGREKYDCKKAKRHPEEVCHLCDSEGKCMTDGCCVCKAL